VRAEYAPGEVVGDAEKGTAKGAAFSYTGSTLLAAGAYIHKQTPTGFTNNMFVAGGGFKLGGTTVKAGISRERQETATAGTYQNKTVFAGISHKLTQPVELTAGVFRSDYDSRTGPGSRLVGIADASYFFSKSTNVYVEFDANRYRGALIPSTKQTSQRGASVGVRHLF
jgi:predicted porin